MDTATSLSLGRIAIGTITWIAPGLSLRAGLLDATHPQAPFLVRLFGARDLALGVLTLLATAETKPVLLKVGLAVDASDAAAAVMAYRERALRPVPAATIAATATSAVISGLVAVRRQRDARRLG